MSRPRHAGIRSMTAVFRAPLLLALLTVFGLLSALLGDGPWDALSWGALALPLIVIVERIWRAFNRAGVVPPAG